MQGLETTNTWLAILAVASVVQTLVFVGAAIGMFVFYRRTVDSYKQAIEAFERMGERHLSPLATKLGHMVDDIDDITARARRVDNSVRESVTTANNFVWSVATKAWPVLGAARAVKAGLQVLGKRTANGRERDWESDDEISTRGEGSPVSQFERRRHNVS